ncbi:hypothetical protein [Streptomyces sp. CC224B]|uniref:hypothetical protein n=1 Tax=Streptomyces sp. CC224B TaxID=3044571 RepID=UPI0024A894A9|nr:hypothetical protein [Streptomyces sp. CC224B]
MSEKVIDPNGILQFTGDLDQLERDVSELRREASQFRDAGGDVHSEFQGLSAFYEAPEAEQLFASTKPVQTKTDAFADDLEKVAQALSDYAGDVRPLVEKLKQLQIEASAFYIDEVSTDDDWRKDDDKVKHNNRLIDEVNAATQAFHKAERDCHNKITALVDGIKLEPSGNGEQSCGTYGFTDEVLDQAEELPWGAKAERDYDGIEWFTHQAKEVGKGFFVDGVIGTGKALKTLFGGDGWGAAGEAWTNLAKLSVGVTLSLGPAASVFWMAKDEQLPGWLRDSRRAVVETGKGLIAYDQWSKNPARAGGLVGFNALSIAATRGAGSAAKAGAAAKTISAVGKVGRAVDPFTYAAKGVTFTVSKVGDLLAPLRQARTGGSLGVADGSYRLVDEGANAHPRPAAVPDDARVYADSKGNTLYMTRDGAIVDEHGRVLGDMQKEGAGQRELSAADRAEGGKRETPPALRAPERQPVLVGAHATDGARGTPGQVGDDLGRGDTARHASDGVGPHPYGGGAHDLGRGPSAHHDPGGPLPPRDGSSAPPEANAANAHHGADGAHHGGASSQSGDVHADGPTAHGQGSAGNSGVPHDMGGASEHTPGPRAEGPLELGGEAEQRLREAIRGIPRNTMKPKVLEKGISRLAEHPYGRDVAEVITSGKFSHSAGFREVVSSLGSGVDGQYIRAIDQIRFADDLHRAGLRDIVFEVKNSSAKADLDVRVVDEEGKIWGYQMKRLNSNKGPFEQIAKADYLRQLSSSHADTKIMLVDGQGTVADWMSRGIPDELLQVHKGEHPLKSEKGRGVLFVLRLEDGTIVIPPGAKVDPRGVL